MVIRAGKTRGGGKTYGPSQNALGVAGLEDYNVRGVVM